jgi:hypothetical protein
LPGVPVGRGVPGGSSDGAQFSGTSPGDVGQIRSSDDDAPSAATGQGARVLYFKPSTFLPVASSSSTVSPL